MPTYDLSKFIQAHQRDYSTALSEIRNGYKSSHWIWYIFPQLKGLGKSSTSDYYGIQDLGEAQAFLQNEYLSAHLIEISSALLNLECNDAATIMGRPDDMKLKSSMTLFSTAAPNEKVFAQVLDKFFGGKPDYRTLRMLGLDGNSHSDNFHEHADNCDNLRTINVPDDNIQGLRKKYPNGLHFVVGDTHGEYTTLHLLMEKIEFDSQKDHVYFLGDYNAGGNPTMLLRYIAQYYQEDYTVPGFHLIRGNHERELCPLYELQNLPDIIVIKGNNINFYLAHAGMVGKAFRLINEDIKCSVDQYVYAYSLSDNATCYDAPLRQVIWSLRGLYSQKSHYHVWPSEKELSESGACILHGHTPFSQLRRYGDLPLFWTNQRIWFAEDLQSFDIDSNIKGRYSANDSYRGLSCVCLEILDEIAEKEAPILKRERIEASDNFVFSVPYSPYSDVTCNADINKVLNAKPLMKLITLDSEGKPIIL